MSLFVLGKARATASFIPAGFVAVRTARGPMPGHITGPIPGTTNDAQYFLNTPTRQSFVMSVYRGGPIMKSPWFRSSKRTVRGALTYVGTNPITHQREFNWVVGPTTSAFVGGTRMSDALLVRIADGMVVAPS
jgi:hypothetical protein